jgi:FkbM family methyltransferase
MSRRDALRLAFTRKSESEREIQFARREGAIVLRPATVDLDIFAKVFLEREYSVPFPIRPRRIVDAGAHIGMATRFFLQEYPESEIVAIEPLPANLSLLSRNCREHARVEILAGALWGEAARLIGRNPSDESWAHSVATAPDGDGPITGFTIPEILRRKGWDEIDLLKLDIEGAEIEVLATAEPWLSKVRMIAIELHDRMRPGCSRAFYQRIAPRLEAQEVMGENVFVQLNR